MSISHIMRSHFWNHVLNRSIIIPRASSSSATEISPFFSFALLINNQNSNISWLEDFKLKFKSWTSFKRPSKLMASIVNFSHKITQQIIFILPAILSIFCSIISIQTEPLRILLFRQTHCRTIYGLWFFSLGADRQKDFWAQSYESTVVLGSRTVLNR